MNDTIQIIGAAMRNEAESLRVISQNIANAETVAYKRQVATTRTDFDAMLAAQSGVMPEMTATRMRVEHDLKPATLKSTGEPWNVGLDGPGFFLLEASGGPLLTRRGDFHVSADGTLVSSSGAPVLGEKGVIQVGTGKPVIDHDGSITINGDFVDRLRVARVAAESELESVGASLFRAKVETLEEGTERPAVRQGFLEGSNVVPMNEMIQLMETVRRFEAEQKYARAFDGMLDKAISEIGKID